MGVRLGCRVLGFRADEQVDWPAQDSYQGA